MSLVVPCPGCPAQLSAPESAAGKQIRCPKCKAVVAVPAFIPAEVVPVVDAAVSAPPPAPKPKPKPAVTDDEDDEDAPRKKTSRRDDEDDEDRPRKKKRRAYDDDEDDDEEDERPRKKKKRKAASGGGGARVAVLVLGGLILLGGIGFGIYLLVGSGGVFARRAPVPAGWKQYNYPQSGFRAAFPSEPAVFGANVQGGFGGGALPGGVEIPQIESMFSYTTGAGGFGARAGGVNVSVEVNRYSTAIPRSSRDLMTRNGNPRFAGGGLKRVRWLGGDAAEIATGGTLMRMVVLEKAVIVVQITGPNGSRAKPEEENGFFDNFELIK